MASTTGYPMRMLRQSPTLRYAIKPNCEGMGYLLENGGKCTYIDAYYKALANRKPGEPLVVEEKNMPLHRHGKIRLLDLRPHHISPQRDDKPPPRRQLANPFS